MVYPNSHFNDNAIFFTSKKIMRFVAALLFLSLSIPAQAQTDFLFSNQPGRYAVGLHVIQQSDASRTYQGNQPRPIQTLVWYPAHPGGSAMRVLDYQRTSVYDDDFDHSELGELAALAAKSVKAASSLGAVRAEGVMTHPMWAVRDAKAIDGQFPVIVYAAGSGGSASENADLCEYLASNGYVVIASPSMGLHAKRTKFVMSDVRPQQQDISFLIAYTQSLPNADIAHIGVIGFSWGGMATMFAAQDNKKITAVVALEGSFRYFSQLAKQLAPEKLTIPLLYFTQEKTIESLAMERTMAGLESVDASYSLMNDMQAADVYRITERPLQHNDFTSLALRFSPDNHFGEYSREEASTAYSWVARYVLSFLNAYLKSDGASLAFLRNTPLANGVPAHMFAAEVQRAKSTPGKP